jgi:hypothetical protein
MSPIGQVSLHSAETKNDTLPGRWLYILPRGFGSIVHL